MCAFIFRIFTVIALIEISIILFTAAVPQNKTSHHLRRGETVENIFFKNEKLPSYRSFQPVSIKYHKAVYPKPDDRQDYDITSYDTEYGGVVSNFTSSIYDDNPPLYPNPELVVRGNQVIKTGDTRVMDMAAEVDLPDESLADGDLKDHNIIDSVTYLYGFDNCQRVRHEWIALIFIACGIAMVLLSSTALWLMWSEHTQVFRETSRLYPLSLNLCCCLEVCTLIYVQAIVGVSTPSMCEKIALLLHYSHLTCAVWIVLIATSVTEFSSSGSVMSLKYHYLLAYGIPAVVVMFNYALSMEHYEIKHYCWMSIEKGMVMGFMVPAMILIFINTATVILGLQLVNQKQAEVLTAKIQELVDNHIANWPKSENKDPSDPVDALEIYTPGSSRKNTDSSDTLDKEYGYSEDDGNDCNNGNCEDGNDYNDQNNKTLHEKSLLNMLYLDNVSLKSTLANETQQLKAYLNLCLVMEPFFAVNWVMGVVAVENATHWPTPALYVILVSAMYIYLTATICTCLPIIQNENEKINPNSSTFEEVIVEQTILSVARSTDSIPLLDPTIQQPNVTPAPADSISTISI